MEVDISDSSQSIDIYFSVTDDLSGFHYFQVRFDSPNGINEIWDNYYVDEEEVLEFEITFPSTIPTDVEPGTWKIGYLELQDHSLNGNVINYSFEVN